jgi:hypothetical protein
MRANKLPFGGIKMADVTRCTIIIATITSIAINLYSIGLPIYFSKGGFIKAEFPDGRIEIVKKEV